MPRTKNARIPHSGIAEIEWSVYEAYEIGTRKVQRKDTLRNNQEREGLRADSFNDYVEVRAIIRSGEVATSYSLSDPDIHEDLLSDYLNIYDALDALNYVKSRGFLSDDLEPLTPPDLPMNNGCLQAEVLDSAAYLRWLMSLSDAINNMEISILNSYINETSLDNTVGVYMRDQSSGNIYPFETRACAWGYSPVRAEEEPLLYSTQVWKKYGTKRSLYAAQDYLRSALYRLLRGVQPTLDWKTTADGDLIPDEAMAVDTPWHAICYALLRCITRRASLRPCRHCGNRFRAKRSDKCFCSNACGRAHLRSHGKTSHSYPATIEGDN